MKNLSITLFILACSSFLFAQCDYNNSGLESWSPQTVSFDDSDPNLQFSVDLPDDHVSVLRFFFYTFGIAFGDPAALNDYMTDPQAAVGIFESNDAATGNSAVKLQANSYINFADIYSVWRCTELPDSVAFSVKHQGTNMDTLVVLTVFDEGLSDLPQDFDDLASYPAYATTEIVFNSDTEYQNISLPIVENFQANIDTAYMIFVLTTDAGDIAAGNESCIILDDVGLTNTDEVLAINQLDFYAKQSESKVVCQWQTMGEVDNDYFEVEKSQDGIAWNAIGKVRSNGYSLDLSTYQFIDYNPFEGKQYYRLKQIDIRNKVNYSNMVYLDFDSNNQTRINIYPNPATDIINIEVSGDNTYISKLYDLEGKIILKGIDQSKIRVESIPHGTYMLEIKDQTSGKTFMERIVIGR